MKSETQSGPAFIERADRGRRLSAAWIAAKAYAWHPTVLIPALGAGLLYTWLPRTGAAWFPAWLVGSWIVLVGIIGVVAYRGSETILYRAGRSAATLSVKEHKDPDSVVAGTFGASPRRKGAGRVAGSYLLEWADLNGKTIHITALPRLHDGYAREGFVPIRTVLGFTRMVRTPRSVTDHN